MSISQRLATCSEPAGTFGSGRGGAGVMFVTRDGKALLMRRNGAGDHKGEWAFPGGHAEVGESPEQTAMREAREETGYDGDEPVRRRYVGSTDKHGIEFHTFAYAPRQEFAPALTDEHDAFMWAPLNQLPQPLHPGVAETIGTDLSGGEWDGLRTLLNKWLDEEQAEPAHAQDELTLDVPEFLKRDSKSEAKERVAMDRGSVRSFDKNGHLVVQRTPVSKATINEYYGREIPGSEALGLDPARRYRLLRHPDELKAAAETWNGKPLMIAHKPISASDHPKDLVVGSVAGAEFEHPYLYAALNIWDQGAIDAVESGSQKELSSAYHYTADMTPGTFEGQPYDGVMRALHANHVALVRDGRAGSDVVVQDERPLFSWTFGAFAMDKKPTKPISFAAFALDSTFEESKHPRASNGQFGAGVGKSHAEHAEHHGKRADEHLAAANKHARLANQASFGGGDFAGSLKHREAEAAHRFAAERHASAQNLHDFAHARQSANTSDMAKSLHSDAAHAKSKEAHEASQRADAPGTKPEDWKRVKRMKSHTDHARFLAEAEEEPAGYVANHHSAHIPSPYAHSPSHTVYKHKGKNVILKETAHRQFDVHEVPEGVKIHPTHEAAAEEYAEHLKQNKPSFWKSGSQDARPASMLAAFDAQWEESKHPRANNGQFGAGEGKPHLEHARHHDYHAAGIREIAARTKDMSPKVKAMYKDAAEAHEYASRQHSEARSGPHAGSPKSSSAHAASKIAHEKTAAARERENLESYGAGSGKSHEDHAKYHDEHVDRHLDVGAKQASNTYEGGDESRAHFEAAAENAKARKMHASAKTDDEKTAALRQSKAAHEASQKADAHTAEREKTERRRDALTKKHTAFKSFKEMAHAEGGYNPSIEVGKDPEKEELAGHYDDYQTKRGDPRRAFRYGKNVDKAARSGGDKHKTGDGRTHESREAAIAHANEVHRKTGNIISVEKA